MYEFDLTITSQASMDVELTNNDADLDATVEKGDSVNATAAKRLAEERKISLIGDAAGKTMFDGSKDVDIPVAIREMTNLELEALLK